jgi:3-oxoacyl-(acyl-carrier-protein) synthase
VRAIKGSKDPSQRVVITGMGVVSAFGNNVDTFYER